MPRRRPKRHETAGPGASAAGEGDGRSYSERGGGSGKRARAREVWAHGFLRSPALGGLRSRSSGGAAGLSSKAVRARAKPTPLVPAVAGSGCSSGSGGSGVGGVGGSAASGGSASSGGGGGGSGAGGNLRSGPVGSSFTGTVRAGEDSRVAEPSTALSGGGTAASVAAVSPASRTPATRCDAPPALELSQTTFEAPEFCVELAALTSAEG